MVVLANVYIWDIPVGAVLWNDALQYASFEFLSDFAQKNLDLSPIMMPLEDLKNGQNVFSFSRLPKETYKGLPGLVADSLPDRFGNAIMNRWLASTGRLANSINPVELLCYVGKRGMGALEYVPSLHPDGPGVSERLEVDELVGLAQEVLGERESVKLKLQGEKGISDIIKVGTSAGGARAKAILAYNEKTGEIRSGQVLAPSGFTYWIMKFDGVTNKSLGDPMGYGRIEYAYYKMALACGIEMTECRLYEESNRAHFMTKRFDRTSNAEKYHMHTLCGMAHFDYNDSQSYSYEQAFAIMRQLRLSYPNAEQLFRRMVFNVVARNQDDHTKNISFLMNREGRWKLSPAYDMTFAYDPTNRWMRNHQMSINGNHDNIYRTDLQKVGQDMNIKKADFIIDEIVDGVSRWPEFAKDVGVLPDQVKAIGKSHLLSI